MNTCPDAVIRAWEALAPRGGVGEAERRAGLREIALNLTRRRSATFAADVARRVGVFSAILFEQRLDSEYSPDLVKEAIECRRQLDSALARVQDVHRRARIRSWYLWAPEDAREALDKGQSVRAYGEAQAALAEDPLLRFLASRPFPTPGRGNPRNKRAKEAARVVSQIDGLLKREVKDIVALVFNER